MKTTVDTWQNVCARDITRKNPEPSIYRKINYVISQVVNDT